MIQTCQEPPQDPEAEYREVNNGVVVPAYRQFCRELELPFHFWDELPASHFDVSIAREEMALHGQAIRLFNLLKPEFVLFRDSVVCFQLWADDTFTYSKTSIREFVEGAGSDRTLVGKLERRLRVAAGALSVATFFGVYAALYYFGRSFVRRDGLEMWLWGMAAVFVALATAVYVEARTEAVDRSRLSSRQRQELRDMVAELRSRLEEIRRNRPSP